MSPRPIFYAEDEENDAFFLRRAFKEAGISHPLVVVEDGQMAIDYLSGQGGYADRAQHPLPHLVLLDLNLPKKTGIQVLEWIRKHSANPTLPVLILTSSLQDSDIDIAYRQGANAYLAKPSRPSELLVMTKAIDDFWLRQNRVKAMNEDGVDAD